MSIGVRHILPVYVFLSVLIGGAAWALVRQNRRWAYLVRGVTMIHAISSLRTFPVYIAYGQVELWGGTFYRTRTSTSLTRMSTGRNSSKRLKHYLDLARSERLLVCVFWGGSSRFQIQRNNV